MFTNYLAVDSSLPSESTVFTNDLTLDSKLPSGSKVFTNDLALDTSLPSGSKVFTNCRPWTLVGRGDPGLKGDVYHRPRVLW